MKVLTLRYSRSFPVSAVRRATWVLWIAATIVSCGRAEEPVQGADVHVVDLATPTRRTITDEIESFGSVAVRRKTNVTAAVDGIVRALPVDEGDRVAEGDTVAELENVQLEIRYGQALSEIESAESGVLLAEARLSKARENVRRELIGVDRWEIERLVTEFDLEHLRARIERAERLREVGGTTDEELRELQAQQVRMRGDYEALLKDIEIQSLSLSDEAIIRAGRAVPETEEGRIDLLERLNTETEAAQLAVARSRLEAARAELESVELLLEELVVAAPRTGTIATRQVDIGERVQEGSAVVSVFEETPIHALLPVRESETGLVHPGQASEIVVPAVSGESLRGEVERVSATVDSRSGSAAVRVVVENSEGALKPGMFVEGTIIYGGEREALVIPVSSLLRRDGQTASLFLVRGGRALRREIQVGEERHDGTIEVTGGLEEGELLIDSPSPLIREGDRVRE